MQYKPTVRDRALHRKVMLSAWFAAFAEGCSKQTATEKAQAAFEAASGKKISGSQVRRWLAIIEERGGVKAPLEAYCDDKQTPHVASRLKVPEDFVARLKAECLKPGVGEWTAAFRAFEILWAQGEEVPGLGRASAGQPFPFTARQLRKFMPSKAARVQASQGRFRAKVAGLLPAPPISTRNMRLRERIIFDDYRLNVIALDDLTGNPVSVVLYFAMDEGTGEILGYLLREVGAVRQTDVEALTAFVLRVAGFAGAAAGYPTILKYERGTVAISPARAMLLEGLFPGQLVIERTSMISGPRIPGDFRPESSGNFFGKGRLESWFSTLGHYLRHVAGQRGNTFREQPLMLGDLLLTPETISHPAYKRRGSMIEEAVTAAQTARAVQWMGAAEIEEGQSQTEIPSAAAASQATGIKGPLLFVSEVNLAIQSVVAYYNSLRGHRREGYQTLPVPSAKGGLRFVTESSADKAARLLRELTAQGNGLSRISEADAAALLHKVKRVTVKASGARVRISGAERCYWHENSLAIAAAQKSSLGEKVYLALYNPEDPRELYLLNNLPSRVPANADCLPDGEEPYFFEALPLYEAPDANSEAALLDRARRVAANHSRITREQTTNIIPFIADQTARREKNIELAEPLRAAVTVLRQQNPPAELPASRIGAALSQPIRPDAPQPATKAPEPFDEK